MLIKLDNAPYTEQKELALLDLFLECRVLEANNTSVVSRFPDSRRELLQAHQDYILYRR